MLTFLREKEVFCLSSYDGVTFEYANSAKPAPRMFSGGMIYEAGLLYFYRTKKKVIRQGALPTGVYSSFRDILIVALVLTSRHDSWGELRRL